ncbi:MAG: hypothetical protein AAGF20_06065 [Pseudomonadota bacterium]
MDRTGLPDVLIVKPRRWLLVLYSLFALAMIGVMVWLALMPGGTLKEALSDNRRGSFLSGLPGPVLKLIFGGFSVAMVWFLYMIFRQFKPGYFRFKVSADGVTLPDKGLIEWDRIRLIELSKHGYFIHLNNGPKKRLTLPKGASVPGHKKLVKQLPLYVPQRVGLSK